MLDMCLGHVYEIGRTETIDCLQACADAIEHFVEHGGCEELCVRTGCVKQVFYGLGFRF